MKTFNIVIYFLLFAASIAHAEVKVLCEDQSWTPAAKYSDPVRISNGKIINTLTKDGPLVIVAKKKGYSQLDIGKTSYQIHVLPLAQCDLYYSLEKKLSRFLGLKIEIIGKTIYITGRLHRFSDWLALSKSVKDPSVSFVFSARVDDDLKPLIQKYFLDRLKAFSLPRTSIKYSTPLSIHFHPSEKDNTKTIEDLFAPFGVVVRFDKNHVGLKPLVRVNIVVAEVTRDFSRSLGVNWSINASAKLLPSVTDMSEIIAKLEATESSGQAQIHASPTLLSRSGARAEFVSGGEFPIRTYGYKGQGVLWKKHGVLLSILPRADWDGSMSIELSTEISSKDPSPSAHGLPSMKTSRVQSHFDIKGKRTIALSGLLRNNQSISNKKVPLLGHIPILGGLFKNMNESKNQTELIIFVTPEIVKDKSEHITYPRHWRTIDQ